MTVTRLPWLFSSVKYTSNVRQIGLHEPFFLSVTAATFSHFTATISQFSAKFQPLYRLVNDGFSCLWRPWRDRQEAVKLPPSKVKLPPVEVKLPPVEVKLQPVLSQISASWREFTSFTIQVTVSISHLEVTFQLTYRLLPTFNSQESTQKSNLPVRSTFFLTHCRMAPPRLPICRTPSRRGPGRFIINLSMRGQTLLFIHSFSALTFAIFTD